MKKASLKDIVNIRSGYLFTRKFDSNPDGNIHVIQLKDVDNNGKVDTGRLYTVTLDKINPSLFVDKGDIIFKAKSNNPVAAAITNKMDKTIATAHYFILKLNKKGIHSDYLAWFLNQPIAQRYFKMYASGTRIQIVNKKILGELEVLIPNIKTQKLIVQIENLWHKEKELTEELIKLKGMIVTAKLEDVLNKRGR
jgi:restriction endonuclease S subunit